MTRAPYTASMVVAVSVIGVAAIIAAVHINNDGNPANDGLITTIFTFATGLATAVILIARILASIHTTMNSRLDELVEATRAAANAKGHEEGRIAGRAEEKIDQGNR